MPIRWEDLSASVYEDMVAVLLSHLNPQVQRIDGAGGDGGRDVQFRSPDGLTLYELKSFTGRMGGSQRQQVKASLSRAAQHSPIRWELIVPIDPTPGELRWFEELSECYAFPLCWRDRTWLNAAMAERPCIPRYFLEGARDEVVELLRELNHEEAALTGGVTDALARVNRIATRLNESDPYYSFEVSSDGTSSRVRIGERYRGAAQDRPIAGCFSLSFPGDAVGQEARQRFERFLDFGEAVELSGDYVEAFTIDAPFMPPGTYENAVVLRLSPAAVEAPTTFELSLVAESSTGQSLAELPLRLTVRSGGRRGVVMTGSDFAQVFRMSLELDRTRHSMSFRFNVNFPDGVIPEDLLPAIDMLEALRSPNSLTLKDTRSGARFGDPCPAPDVVSVENDHLLAVRALARLQRKLRVRFPMPSELTPEDQDAIGEALHLLDGRDVIGTWDHFQTKLIPTDLPALRQHLAAEGGASLVFIERDHIVHVAGRRISLGPMNVSLESARLANPEALEAEVGNGEAVELELLPGSTNRFASRLARSE